MKYTDLVTLIKDTRKTLFILCGLPYSGKTYLAQQIIAATGCSYVSIDDFFHKDGYDWTINKLPDADGWNAIFTASYDATKEALGANKNVLYDSTNHTRASRDKLRAAAQELGAETAVIFIDVPTETVWSRWEANRQSKSRSVVDRKLVQMTIDSFEKPTEDERTYTITNEEDIVQIVDTTPEILEKAQFYLNLIKRIVPNATVSLIGSLAIPISTKNEMDILIEIEKDEDIQTIQEKIRDESEGVFGVGPIADGEGFSRSKKKYGIICELHILHKGNAKIQSYQELVRRFRADPDLAAKYEKLKRSLNGVPSSVYKAQKAQFLKDNNLI